MKLIEGPLGDDVLKLDLFVVMNSGRESLQRLQRSAHPKTQDQLKNRVTIYHYYPPTKSVSSVNYAIEGLGGIVEDKFTKSGVAVIVEDVVSSGRTFRPTVEYVNRLGYSFDEIFLFSQRHFMPKPEDKGLGSMWPYEFVHISNRMFSDLLGGILPKNFEEIRFLSG